MMEPKTQKDIRSHLVLLYEPETAENGSGVLLQVNDKVFVVTAAHVISDTIQVNLGLSFQSSPLRILDRWTDNALDIGFLELRPFEVEVYRADEAKPYKVRGRLAVTTKSGAKVFALCGYPSNQHFKDGNKIGFTPLLLTCPMLPYELWPQSLQQHGKTPRNNFAIPCGEKHGGPFRDREGKPLKILPKGMSGCGLWFFCSHTENLDIPLYSLVGIQHSHFPQDDVLVGTFIDPVIDVISQRYGIHIQDFGSAAVH